jgi:succinate dehydrogenase / fumarate reductase cytochrome b subunit
MTAHANRPLSPHLQVYRWELTMTLSILHRMTGVFLSLGTVALAAWLVAAAMGGASFAAINDHLGAWYGQLLLLGWSYVLFYHLCNGIRHLVWDAGFGFGKETARVSGYVTLAASVLLTVVAWWFVCL